MAKPKPVAKKKKMMKKKKKKVKKKTFKLVETIVPMDEEDEP
jgi:hypothetical protein